MRKSPWLNSCCIRYINDVKQIIEPLLFKFDFTYFSLFRSYHNSNFFILSNRGDWLEHFFERDFIISGAFQQDPKLFHPNIKIPWSAVEANPVMENATKIFNITNGITFSEKHHDFTDFYHFGTTKENFHVNNFYVNHQSILKYIIYYFKEKAQRLIKTSALNPMSDKRRCNMLVRKFFPLYDQKILQEALLEFKINRLYFDDNYLTSRELECLKLLCQGKTSIETSQALGISSRTCEIHLQKCKEKLSCKKQTELVKKAYDLGMIF